MTRTRSTLAVLAVAFATLLVWAQPAAAADNAYNYKTQFLTATPTSANPPSCVSRRIQLAAGNYTWGQKMGSTEIPRRTLYLGYGAYTWTDCLVPYGGSYDYDHVSSLDPDNPAWATARITITWNLSVSATYQWGSWLDPQFCTVCLAASPGGAK